MKHAKEIAIGLLLLVCADIIAITLFFASHYHSLNTQDAPFSTALLFAYALGGCALAFLITLYIVAVRLFPLISKKLTGLLAGIAWAPVQFVNPISCGSPSGWEQLASLLTTAIGTIIIAVVIAWTTNKLQNK